MKNEIERLKQLTNVYSNVHAAIRELTVETMKLDKMSIELNEVLDRTRDEEKEIINKLEKKLGRTLGPTDILEIIQNHEEGSIL
jgi:hypothetical protein